MKKITTLFITFLLMFSLTSCSATEGKPEDVVEAFCKGLQTVDLSSDESIEQLNVYYREDLKSQLGDSSSDVVNSEKIYAFLNKNLNQVQYNVLEATVDGETAKVPVEFTIVDSSGILTEAFTTYMTEAISLTFNGEEMTEEKSADLFVQSIEKVSAKAEPKSVDKLVEFTLEKADGKWVISDTSAEFDDVLTSNLVTAVDDLETTFNALEETTSGQ